MNTKMHDDSFGSQIGDKSITRRGFLVGSGVTVAALMLPFLGIVDGKRAYALDYLPSSDEGEEEDPTAHIFVLSRSEVGLAVYDVDSTGTTSAVAGAKVVIEWEGADSTWKREAISDEFGAVVFDIKDVGDTVDYGSMGFRYTFVGSVTVTNGSGYRVCTLKKIRVESGTALKIPCCKITDAALPYFESLSFNGWDMQYCNCEVVRCPQATNPIPLEGTLHMNGANSARIEFYARSTEKNKELVKPALFSEDITLTNGVGSFSRAERYLYYDPDVSTKYEKLLPLNCTFEIHLNVGEANYIIETKLSVVEPRIPFKSGNQTLVAGDTGLGTFTFPDSAPPLIRGSKFSMWVPSFPVFFWMSPHGVVVAGVGINFSKAANSIAAFKEENFALETSVSLKQQVKSLMDALDRKSQAYDRMSRGAADPNNSSFLKHGFSSSLSADINVQAFLSAFFDENDSSRVVGKLSLVFDLALRVSLTEQLIIGGFPAFITFTMELDSRMANYLAIQVLRSLPLSIGIIHSQSGVAIVLTISVSLTIGAGIAGIISFGIRGSGFISMYTGLLDASSMKDSPHFVLAAGLSADVVVQAILFKWVFNIWSYDCPALYDSWNTTASVDTASPSGVSASTSLAFGAGANGGGVYSNTQPLMDAGISMEEFIKDASIITAEELLHSSELRATKVGSLASDDPASESLEPIALENGMYVTPLSISSAARSEDGTLLGDSAGAVVEYADGYSYEYCGSDPEGDCSGAAGVEGVHEQGGVIPTKDVTVVRNAFSDSREKIVIYDSIVYLFRLASVEYTVNGQPQGRTRLVAQIFNDGTGRWGRPQVLDIPCQLEGIAREDMFDFDFDVCTQTNTNPSSYLYQGIYVSLVSSLRENGNNTTFDQAVCAPILSVAVFNRNLRRHTSSMWRDDPSAAKGNPYAITCPRIATLDMSNSKPSLVVMTYLRHSAARSSEVFGPNATTTCHVAVPLKGNLVHTSSMEMAPSTFAMSITPIDANLAVGGKVGAFSVFAQSNKTTGGVVTSAMSIHTVALGIGDQLASATTAEEERAALRNGQLTFKVVRNINQADAIDDLRPWPGHSGFLSLRKGELFETAYDPSVEDGQLSSKPIGPSTLRLGAFKTSANGNVLFFVENKEGKSAQAFDSATGEPLEGETENRYRVSASLCEGGLFSEPFPIGVLSHPLDTLEGISGRSTYAFLGSCITSTDPVQADLHYLDIPVLATATVRGLSAEELFAPQGGDAAFLVVLRNDGNVILTGCRVTLYDADTNEAVSTAELSFTSNNICASVWNPELAPDASEETIAAACMYPDEAVRSLNANSKGSLLANPVESGVLLPGKTSQYRVVLSIPSTWHGEKDVRVGVSDFSYEIIVSGAGDGAGAAPLQHAAPQSSLPSTGIFVHSESEAFDPNLSMPRVWKASENGDAGSSGDTNQGGASVNVSQSGSGSRADATPRTGDSSDVTVAGLLAGAAVAGFSAYSARRTKFENKQVGDGGESRDEQLL